MSVVTLAYPTEVWRETTHLEGVESIRGTTTTPRFQMAIHSDGFATTDPWWLVSKTELSYYECRGVRRSAVANPDYRTGDVGPVAVGDPRSNRSDVTAASANCPGPDGPLLMIGYGRAGSTEGIRPIGLSLA